MKFNRYYHFILITALMAVATTSGAEDRHGQEPIVFMPETQFVFQPVVEGTEVVHDFVVMNHGTDMLFILNVKTSCGCTAVSYTRIIPAGSEGKVTVKVNTSGYGGILMKKSVIVETSAAQQPTWTLSISGSVDKFAAVTPSRLILMGNAGEPVSGSVTIIPDPKFPFKVLEYKVKNGTDIQVKIADKEEKRTTAYVLTVDNIKKDPGRYYDVILLKTDSPVKPEIQIGVFGQILASGNKALHAPQ